MRALGLNFSRSRAMLTQRVKTDSTKPDARVNTPSKAAVIPAKLPFPTNFPLKKSKPTKRKDNKIINEETNLNTKQNPNTIIQRILTNLLNKNVNLDEYL
jgi:hypothetical protein